MVWQSNGTLVLFEFEVNEIFSFMEVKLQTCSKYARSGCWATSHLNKIDY